MGYIKKNNYGQYIIPDPENPEKEKRFTRVTTAVKALDDTYHLGQWAKRMVAFGLGQREDLVAKAMSIKDPDKDKKTLDEIAEEAMHAAQSSKKSNLGTALHGFTERYDAGETEVKVPASMRKQFDNFVRTTRAHGLVSIPELIEATVVLPALTLAGTADRFYNWAGSELPIVGDLKTGSTIDFSKIAIAQQLAAYANSEFVWDGDDLTPMPEVNKEWGLVIHLPSDGDTCTVYRVDLVEGYRLLEMSVGVREVRSTRGKHLFTEVELDDDPTTREEAHITEEERIESFTEELRTRARALIAVPANRPKFKQLWHVDVPKLTQSGHTMTQLELIERWLDIIESGAPIEED